MDKNSQYSQQKAKTESNSSISLQSDLLIRGSYAVACKHIIHFEGSILRLVRVLLLLFLL